MMSEMKDAKIFLEPMDPLKYAVSIEVNKWAILGKFVSLTYQLLDCWLIPFYHVEFSV